MGYGLVVGVAAVLGMQFLGALHGASAAEGQVCLGMSPVKMGSKAPTFELADVRGGGRKVRLADYRGKVVLLHFWFTRCRPCIEELPSLASLNRQMSGKDFAVVTVSVDENHADVTRFLARYGLAQLPVAYDKSKKTPHAYGTKKYPESYLIDRTGVARYRFVNKRNWSSSMARQCIRTLL